MLVRVKVRLKAERIPTMRNRFITRATAATTPAPRYQMIMKAMTAIKPMVIAMSPCRMESSPKEAPMDCWLLIFRSTGRAPVRRTRARLLASSRSKPVIRTLSRIPSEIRAPALTFSSSTMARVLSTLALVSWKKISPPSLSSVKLITGLPVRASLPTWASTM